MPDTTKEKAAAPTEVSDANASSETLEYIDQLRQTVNNTQAKLNSKTAALSSAETRKSKVAADLTNAKSHRDATKQNLEKANVANSELAQVIKFFDSRKKVTTNMASDAKNVAEQMYGSLVYVIKEGAKRVEQLQNSVVGANAATDSDSQWTNTFVSSINESMQLGLTAMNDGKAAVAAAFESYRSCQQINLRTGEYQRYLKEFHGQLQSIIQRLTSENAMAVTRVMELEGQLVVVDGRVADLAADKNALTFELAHAQAKYDAAQQGAQYSAANSAGS